VSTPRGRRPGTPDTRAAILGAARESFAGRGFAGTTIRGIAAAAGVDAALVHHYFGAKDDLFLAALELPVDPRQVIAPALAGGPDGAAERLLTLMVGVWDDPELRLPFLTMLRAAMEPGGGRLLTEGFVPVVVRPVLRAVCRDRPDDRLPLVASQILGLLLARYVLELEPLASMPAERAVATYAPTIQRYLTGDLP
jgi:AcrR family transcriptional regulator